MRLCAILVFQAMLSIRIQLAADAKEPAKISHGERLYNFTLSDCEPSSNVTVKITAHAQKDTKKALPELTFNGTPASVEAEIAAHTLEVVVAKPETYDVKVKATDHTAKKNTERKYSFTAVPKIKVTYLHRGLFKNVTFPLKYAKVEGAHQHQALRIRVDADPDAKADGVEVEQQGHYIMLNKVKEGPPPELRFHLVEADSEHRSEDIVVPAPGQKHNVNRLQKIIFGISLSLVVAMIATLGVYYYRNRNTPPPTDEERGAVPLFTSPGMPCRTNIAVDPYAPHPNVLDLRDAHAK